MALIRILIADDHQVLRDGLARLLGLEEDFAVVALVGDGQAAVEQAVSLRPDVALLDILMPGVDGVEATRRIKAAAPEVGVIVLTGHPWDDYLVAAVREGAAGFLLKTDPFSRVAGAVRAVAAGQRLVAEVAAGHAPAGAEEAPGAPPGQLSRRELEVAQLLAQGLPNRQISQRLQISEKTVKKHVGHILLKLGAQSRTEAILTAARRGLVRLTDR